MRTSPFLYTLHFVLYTLLCTLHFGLWTTLTPSQKNGPPEGPIWIVHVPDDLQNAVCGSIVGQIKKNVSVAARV